VIVYFAAVNQTHFCEAFAGRHVLESFADSRKLFGRYRATFKSMALDCGAYSELRTGKPIDIHRFADFCHQHGRFYDFVASLDSIRGGVKENLDNWCFLLDRGLDVVPTYHQGEPVSVLQEYCARAPRVGLGFQRDEHNRTHDEIPFLDQAFAVIPSDVKVHGWAMTNYTARYPFASVDSRTWLFELKALRNAQTTQGRAFDHLTDGELIEIIQKRYDRLPRMREWAGVEPAVQLGIKGVV
jgi:hypothetical protein